MQPESQPSLQAQTNSHADDGAVSRVVDMLRQKPVLCGQNIESHAFELQPDGRSLTCSRCGYGFRMQPHNTREEAGGLIIESKNGDLHISLGKSLN